MESAQLTNEVLNGFIEESLQQSKMGFLATRAITYCSANKLGLLAMKMN